MTVEYGVRYRPDDGDPFEVGGFTESGARRLVTEAGKGFCPTPAEVVRREVGDWQTVDEAGAT